MTHWILLLQALIDIMLANASLPSPTAVQQRMPRFQPWLLQLRVCSKGGGSSWPAPLSGLLAGVDPEAPSVALKRTELSVSLPTAWHAELATEISAESDADADEAAHGPGVPDDVLQGCVSYAASVALMLQGWSVLGGKFVRLPPSDNAVSAAGESTPASDPPAPPPTSAMSLHIDVNVSQQGRSCTLVIDAGPVQHRPLRVRRPLALDELIDEQVRRVRAVSNRQRYCECSSMLMR